MCRKYHSSYGRTRRTLRTARNTTTARISIATNALTIAAYVVRMRHPSVDTGVSLTFAYPTMMNSTCVSTTATSELPMSRCHRNSRYAPAHRSRTVTRLINANCVSSR